jgi:hypothetical protein
VGADITGNDGQAAVQRSTSSGMTGGEVSKGKEGETAATVASRGWAVVTGAVGQFVSSTRSAATESLAS